MRPLQIRGRADTMRAQNLQLFSSAITDPEMQHQYRLIQPVDQSFQWDARAEHEVDDVCVSKVFQVVDAFVDQARAMVNVYAIEQLEWEFLFQCGKARAQTLLQDVTDEREAGFREEADKEDKCQEQPSWFAL